MEKLLLQHQLCVIKVSNLRTYNGSHVFNMLRNHPTFSSSTARFTLHCRFLFPNYDDYIVFHHLCTAA